jgi:hypothetical protein
MTPDGGYVEGFQSLADGGAPMRFDLLDARADLRAGLRGHWNVERMAWFAHGFIALREEATQVPTPDGPGARPATLTPQTDEGPSVVAGLTALLSNLIGAPVSLFGILMSITSKLCCSLRLVARARLPATIPTPTLCAPSV